MTDKVLAQLGFSDPRRFFLLEVGQGHAHALLRGFPEVDEDALELVTPRVVDLLFAGVVRVSCWRDFDEFEIRKATEAERATLAARIGKFRDEEFVYLLETGTLESYVIAARVYWAEFDMPPGEDSPLLADDRGDRMVYQPVDGIVRYA